MVSWWSRFVVLTQTLGRNISLVRTLFSVLRIPVNWLFPSFKSERHYSLRSFYKSYWTYSFLFICFYYRSVTTAFYGKRKIEIVYFLNNLSNWSCVIQETPKIFTKLQIFFNYRFFVVPEIFIVISVSIPGEIFKSQHRNMSWQTENRKVSFSSD